MLAIQPCPRLGLCRQPSSGLLCSPVEDHCLLAFIAKKSFRSPCPLSRKRQVRAPPPRILRNPWGSTGRFCGRFHTIKVEEALYRTPKVLENFGSQAQPFKPCKFFSHFHKISLDTNLGKSNSGTFRNPHPNWYFLKSTAGTNWRHTAVQKGAVLRTNRRCTAVFPFL